MKKNLRSEAAIKRVIKNWNNIKIWHEFLEPLIEFYVYNGEGGVEAVARIDLRDFIKKRKPLTGIKKQVDKIVRGSNAKQSRKK